MSNSVTEWRVYYVGKPLDAWQGTNGFDPRNYGPREQTAVAYTSAYGSMGLAYAHADRWFVEEGKGIPRDFTDDAGLVKAYPSVGQPVKGPAPAPEVNGQAAQVFKADDGKPRYDLLMTKEGCAKAVAGVVRVLSFAVRPKEQGGKGYEVHSWRKVPEGERRYLSALYRHLAAVEAGEVVDSESGESHWYHIATNALFLAELHNKESE